VRVLRVMRERGLRARQEGYRVSRRMDWNRVGAPQSNLVWQSDMTRFWAGPSTGWSTLTNDDEN